MKIDNIEELNDLICEMEKRLELFIGDNNLGRLFCFIDGYIYSKSINKIPFTKKEEKYNNNFYIWLKKYYQYPSNIWAGAETIIMFHAGSSNRQATKIFFELYKKWYKEEFGEECHVQPSCCDIQPSK